MQQAIPMQQTTQELPLRGLHLPPEPGFWPLAPGWWVLMAVLFILLLWFLVRWYQKHQRKKQLLAIEAQLTAIEQAHQDHNDQQQLLADVSMLLRRFEKFHQNQNLAVSHLGQNWIDHLNSRHNDRPFDPWAQLLTQGIYQPSVSFDHLSLLALTRQHIKTGVMKPQKNQQGGQDV